MLSDPDYGFYSIFSTNSKEKDNINQGKQHGERPGPSGSLEALHNNYHGLIGMGGHMGRVPLAAFDPVFWMHHA